MIFVRIVIPDGREKVLCIDAEPVADGALVRDLDRPPDGARFLAKGERWSGFRYQSHFDSCPFRDDFGHRRKR
jgi:hypothetical protein